MKELTPAEVAKRIIRERSLLSAEHGNTFTSKTMARRMSASRIIENINIAKEESISEISD